MYNQVYFSAYTTNEVTSTNANHLKNNHLEVVSAMLNEYYLEDGSSDIRIEEDHKCSRHNSFREIPIL